MIDIAFCILGIVGIIACRIIENIMVEHDREKALGYEFERYCCPRWSRVIRTTMNDMKGENNDTSLDN